MRILTVAGVIWVALAGNAVHAAPSIDPGQIEASHSIGATLFEINLDTLREQDDVCGCDDCIPQNVHFTNVATRRHPMAPSPISSLESPQPRCAPRHGRPRHRFPPGRPIPVANRSRDE